MARFLIALYGMVIVPVIVAAVCGSSAEQDWIFRFGCFASLVLLGVAVVGLVSICLRERPARLTAFFAGVFAGAFLICVAQLLVGLMFLMGSPLLMMLAPGVIGLLGPPVVVYGFVLRGAWKRSGAADDLACFLICVAGALATIGVLVVALWT